MSSHKKYLYSIIYCTVSLLCETCDTYFYGVKTTCTFWTFTFLLLHDHLSYLVFIFMFAYIWVHVYVCLWGVCEVYAQVCMQVYIYKCKRGTPGILSPFLPFSLLFLCLFPLKQGLSLNFLAMLVPKKFQAHFYMALGFYLCFPCCAASDLNHWAISSAPLYVFS